MSKYKILIPILLLGAFLSNSYAGIGDLTSSAGSKAIDQDDGKDLKKFLKPNQCINHYPWGSPVVLDKSISSRLFYFCKMTYASAFDPMLKLPLWTSEVLNTVNIDNMGIGEKLPLPIESTDLPKRFKTFTSDYANSGFDFGFMASPENMFVNLDNLNDEQKKLKKQYAMEESYDLSNVVPMIGSNLKSGLWLQLETTIKIWAAYKKEIFVTTGPIFLNGQYIKKIGASQIPVPTHFYKIITHPQTYGSVAYIFPNKEIVTKNTKSLKDPSNAFYCGDKIRPKACSLDDFVVSIKEIERVTGLEFFPRLAPYYATQIKLDINLMDKKK